MHGFSRHQPNVNGCARASGSVWSRIKTYSLPLIRLLHNVSISHLILNFICSQFKSNIGWRDLGTLIWVWLYVLNTNLAVWWWRWLYNNTLDESNPHWFWNWTGSLGYRQYWRQRYGLRQRFENCGSFCWKKRNNAKQSFTKLYTHYKRLEESKKQEEDLAALLVPG